MIKRFIQKHASFVTGVLSGLDRVRFRGTLRRIANSAGLETWLRYLGVPFREFKSFAEGLTTRIVEGAVGVANAADRPVRYLESSTTNKEEVAREIAARDGIEEGLVCVLMCVEPCQSFSIRHNPETGKPGFTCQLRKCKHIYHYWMDPQLGWMHTRLQSWLPFNFWICINGREWLGRQMDGQGMGYQRRGNCFVALEDAKAAQCLMDRQLKTAWERLLSGFVSLANPAHQEVFASDPLDHYWSADETEWATDIMFRSAKALASLYPKLTSHAITALSSPDIMRFLGRRSSERIHGNFAGQIVGDLRERPEGLRVKHRVNNNSIKMYDKEGSVLRVETTINQPREFRVYRRPEGRPKATQRWLPMRKGVADLHRRSQVSQRANERYLDALTGADTDRTLGELVTPLCQPVTYQARRIRPLNPMATDDRTLLQAIASGEFAVQGFRNRHIRHLLFGTDPEDDRKERLRRSGVVSRKLRLLRGHGLIRRIPKTHRYLLTTRGRDVISAILLAQAAKSRKLAAAA